MQKIISDFFIVDCVKMQPIRLLVDIMNSQTDQETTHSLKRIRVVGFNETYNTSDMLDKLAILADGTYQGLSSEGLAGEDELPVLDGTLNVYANAYEDSVESLRGAFKKLMLNVFGEFYLRFKDKEVGEYMISTLGDGIGITKNRLSQITASQFGKPFRNNTEISNFDEFQYMTSVGMVDTELFLGCTSLSSIILPNNITGIYNSSFYSNINLKSIIIPKTVKEMSQAVFEKCSNLESCVFEEGRTETLKYRWSLFMQCTSLKELIFPDDCIIDGNNNNMFDGCTSLKRVILPKNTTVLGSNFFRNCTSLEEVNLPATITSIGRSAFQGCAIKSIILPNIQNVILDGNVFYECKNLESITIPGGYDIGTLASSLFGYCEALVDATLEEGITVIAPNLFNRCIALKKVMLPSTVTTIGTSIFLMIIQWRYL